jgi:hypothetical protein
MKIWLKIAELFGLFEKLKVWMQGKKTYLVNLIQVAAGLGALLALAGQVLDLAGKTLSLIMGWGDSGQDTGAAMESIKSLWANHAVLVAGFSAAFYSITDAFSKMATYAAGQRIEKKRSAAYGPVQKVGE